MSPNSLTPDSWTRQCASTFHVAWIGNLIHHYPLNRGEDLLRQFSSLARPARIVIQEYPLSVNGSARLEPAILGLHFLLTTGGGRTYTDHEIRALVEKTARGFEFEHFLDFGVSALFVFRRI